MLDYDPRSSLKHYPLPMARFGRNPQAENLYRIVFAPSRRSIVYGEWPDGTREARYAPRYPEAGNAWILERWIPAAEYARCSREEWDLKFSILGPYPERGEYELAHVFEACGPTDANLEKLVAWIEESRRRSYFENRTALKDDYEREERRNRSTMDAIVRNALPAHCAASAISGAHASRNQKTAPIVRSAEELGLPTAHNKFISTGRKHGNTHRNRRAGR